MRIDVSKITVHTQSSRYGESCDPYLGEDMGYDSIVSLHLVLMAMGEKIKYLQERLDELERDPDAY